MGMTFHYTCECGHQLTFAATSAGTLVPCRCGRQVKIPKLSDLKRLAGQPTEFISIADQLRTMYLDKQLPPDTHCMLCQTKTASTLECWVECERAKVYASGIGPTVVTALFVNAILPFFGWIYLPPGAGVSRDAEAYGNDLVVRTPLSICENCLHRTSRTEASIRTFLRSVPLYRQLLDTYPGARVGVS